MKHTSSRPLLCAVVALLVSGWLVPAASWAAPATPLPNGSPVTWREAVLVAQGETADENKLGAVTQAFGTIQSLLEFYFMETGQYPDALEDMLTQYNQGVKQSEPLVKVPTDPATGKKFIYVPSPDRSKYMVKAPEPAAYGLASLEVHQIDWGWMVGIATEQKKKRQTVRCAQYMQLVAEQIEQYNKANRNHYPESLEQLLPKYLQKLPTCPLSKQPYRYSHTDRGFEVTCPDAAAHGLERFSFSSTEGLKRYP